jgi:hypothetical protein
MLQEDKGILRLRLKALIIKKNAYELMIEDIRKKLYPEKFKDYTPEEEEEMRKAFILNERERLKAMMQELDKEEELPF